MPGTGQRRTSAAWRSIRTTPAENVTFSAEKAEAATGVTSRALALEPLVNTSGSPSALGPGCPLLAMPGERLAAVLVTSAIATSRSEGSRKWDCVTGKGGGFHLAGAV